MSSHPSDPSVPENQGKTRNNLDETSGFDSLPKTDETSAFQSETKLPKNLDHGSGKKPRKVGGYALGDMLGQGGMGRVFRADDSTGRSVALKLLSPDLARSPEALARFKQEGLIASQINHPHCVFVHRVDDDAGTPFIAMELMTGQTLKDLVVKNGPLPYEEAIRLILQCIDGLIEAHSLGMIHRDIKPANCYLDDDGNVKVGDFGLARSLVSDSELTQTGAFLGTPLFASPEQLLGQNVDARSDIYSLTATMYYLLAGKAPFESPHAAQVIARIASSDPPSFKSVGVDVPPSIEQIVMKGLSRDATKRYGSFTQMSNELRATIEPKAVPTSLVRRASAWILDYFIMVVLVGILMFLVIGPKKLSPNSPLINLLGMTVIFAYYGICELLFSASLGKAALRVKVVDAVTGNKAHYSRILLRTLVYSFSTGIIAIAIKLAVPNMSPLAEGVSGFASFFASIALICSTWWYTEERQLLNDWASGTECRTRTGSRASVRSSINLPDWKLPLLTSSIQPESFGRFEVNGEINAKSTTEGVRWFLGQDKQLERAVWIAYLSDGATPFDEQQSDKPKSVRLRFIEEGATADSGRWFAFVAPEGVPLLECVKQGTQFPWPITRSLLGEATEMIASTDTASSDKTSPAESNKNLVLDPNRVWIDSLGRMSLADFGQSRDKDFSLVPLICQLGLPPRHHLRKSLGALRNKSALPVESLPPLKAMNALENFLFFERSITSTNLKQTLEKVDKESHELTASARFVSAAASMGLMTPVVFFGGVMLVVPSVILIGDGIYKEVRKLKSLAAYVESPERYEEQWKLVSDAEKTRWLNPEKKAEIAEALEVQSARLRIAMQNVGTLERMTMSNMPGVNLDSPPIYGQNGSVGQNAIDNDSSENNANTMEIKAGPANVVKVNLGKETIDSELMKQILGSVDRSKQIPSGSKKIPDLYIVGLGVVGCILWTTFTFGGVTKHFTGICFFRRDGRRLGIVRSFVRATLLFTPFLILTFAISYCNLQGYEYLWWGYVFKRIFFAIPVVYLVCTLIWYKRTPLDLLSSTVAVPR